MEGFISPELVRSTCDLLSDVNQFGALVFDEERIWSRVLDQSSQLQCEASLGREVFDFYQTTCFDEMRRVAVFPVWFENLKHSIERMEKEFIASTKEKRERERLAWIAQGRSVEEVEAWLKQEAERDKQKDLKLHLLIHPEALLSEERPQHPTDAALTFPAEMIELCGMDPRATLFVTAIEITCKNVHPLVEAERFHRWRMLYRVTDDLMPIPVPKIIDADMFTHGICVNTKLLSDTLNTFVLITDCYIDVTIHGGQLILSQEDDGCITTSNDGRAISPLHLFNMNEVTARKRHVSSVLGAVEPWFHQTWPNTEPLKQRHLLRHLFFLSKAKNLADRVLIAASREHGIVFHNPTVGFGCAGANEEKQCYTRYNLLRAS